MLLSCRYTQLDIGISKSNVYKNNANVTIHLAHLCSNGFNFDIIIYSSDVNHTCFFLI